MKVLVTGGAGFLGKAVALRLLKAGHAVRSFSRGSYPELNALGIETHSGDIADPAAVLAAAKGCDAVIHTAAKAGIWGPYRDFHSSNIVGTENVLRACRELGIRRLVYTSSPSVVYHGGDIEGWDEHAPYPRRFEAHYASTKAEAERRVLDANGAALATVALRPHLIWGPGDNHLIPRVIEKGRKGRLRHMRSDKPCMVDCIYIDNAADAHLLALEKLEPRSPISGKTYFLSQGEPIALDRLIDRILAAADLPAVTRSISPRAAYVVGAALELVHSALGLRREPIMTRFLARQLSTSHWFDISAARRDLGYAPAVSIDQGFELLKHAIDKAGDKAGDQAGRA